MKYTTPVAERIELATSSIILASVEAEETEEQCEDEGPTV